MDLFMKVNPPALPVKVTVRFISTYLHVHRQVIESFIPYFRNLNKHQQIRLLVYNVIVP